MFITFVVESLHCKSCAHWLNFCSFGNNALQLLKVVSILLVALQIFYFVFLIM